MLRFAFFVDESSFGRLTGSKSEVFKQLDIFVEVVEYALEDVGHQTHLTSSVYQINWLGSGQLFIDALFGDYFSENRDLALRLQRILARCEMFDGASHKNRPAAAGRFANGTFPLSAEAVHEAIVRRSESECIGVLIQIPGLVAEGGCEISDGTHFFPAFVLMSPSNGTNAYRFGIEKGVKSEALFFELADRAFPKLHRHPDLSFKKFSRNYAEVNAAVFDHFVFLNDEFPKLARENNWDLPRMIRAARVSFSDESTNTKKNKKAMRYRDIQFGGETISCTWHTKLSKTRDRIHFHPPIGKKFDSKLLIGAFAEHFPT